MNVTIGYGTAGLTQTIIDYFGHLYIRTRQDGGVWGDWIDYSYSIPSFYKNYASLNDLSNALFADGYYTFEFSGTQGETKSMDAPSSYYVADAIEYNGYGYIFSLEVCGSTVTTHGWSNESHKSTITLSSNSSGTLYITNNSPYVLKIKLKIRLAR